MAWDYPALLPLTCLYPVPVHWPAWCWHPVSRPYTETFLSLARRRCPQWSHVLPLSLGIAVLFGDGAGACLVSAESGAAEILESAIYSDGAFSEDLCLPFDAPLKMNGRAVIMQASRKIPRVIAEVLERSASHLVTSMPLSCTRPTRT